MTGKLRSYRAAVSVAVLACAAVVLALSGLVAVGDGQLVADLTGLLGAVAAAAVFAWTGWHRIGAERKWRWIMAFALAWWIAAHGLWTLYNRVDPNTFPNAANALYIGLPLFGFFALLTLVHKDREAAGERVAVPPHAVVILDGLVIVGSLLALSWEIAVEAVRHARNVPIGRLIMVTSYTVAHLVLVVIAILFAITLHSILRLPLVWLILGIIAIGFSHAVYIYSISNTMIAPPIADVGYMIGPVLFLVAALVPNRQLSRRVPQISLLFLPYAPLIAVCAFTLFNTVSAGKPRAGEVYVLAGIMGLVVLRQLVTLRQLHSAHQQLAHQATHDPLTGVSNRNLLLVRLGRALSQDQPQPSQLALLYADLDHFKEINDNLGHEAGDAVLRAVAARLSACIRDTDTLSRIGGDEFVIFLNPAPENQHSFVQRIQSIFREPVTLFDSPYTVSVSLGYARLNAGDTPDEALARADMAMYKAKYAARIERAAAKSNPPDPPQ